MSRKAVVVVLAGFAALALGLALADYAAAQMGGGGGDGGGRMGRGGAGGNGGTPEEIAARREEARNRVLDRAREQLGFTEDEWTQVKPRYEKVTELNRDLNMGGMGRAMGGRGGRGGRGGNMGGGPGGAGGSETTSANAPGAPEQTELDKARQGLREVLDNQEATPEQIKTALTKYRDVRKKGEAELEKAQASLREVLSVRQEAMLVSQGLLK
jgi:hypothetical protein